MDFSKIRIRASAIGNLMTEPKLKADKEAGNLSKTAESYLLKVYAQEKYGRRKDIITKQIEKGLTAEEDSLTLISMFDRKLYLKNEEHASTEFFSGCADIVDDIIIDVKSSWDMDTFLPKLMSDLDDIYFYQMQAYMELYNKQEAKVCFCLVNTPESILQKERQKLLYSMNVATEESPEYKQAVSKLELNHIFDDIPLEEKVIIKHVTRDEDVINKMRSKVIKAREFLSNFEQLHTKNTK